MPLAWPDLRMLQISWPMLKTALKASCIERATFAPRERDPACQFGRCGKTVPSLEDHSGWGGEGGNFTKRLQEAAQPPRPGGGGMGPGGRKIPPVASITHSLVKSKLCPE